MATLYFVVFNQAEVLDFSGPFDVFSMARIATKTDPYDMKIISVDGKPIRAIHGFMVMPEAAISDVTPGKDDIVFIPGGATAILTAIAAGDKRLEHITPDSNALGPLEKDALAKECGAIVTWLAEQCQEAGILATICAGAFFGARAGIFTGQQATTHHGMVSLLDQWIGSASPLPPCQQAQIVAGARYVINKAGAPLILSSAGVSAGLDLSMYLLEQIMCPTAVRLTETLMEYNGTRNFSASNAPQPNIPEGLRFCAVDTLGQPICGCSTS